MRYQACFSARPGTIFRRDDRAFRVRHNDTLHQVITVEDITNGETKRFAYTAGATLELVSRPYNDN